MAGKETGSQRDYLTCQKSHHIGKKEVKIWTELGLSLKSVLSTSLVRVRKVEKVFKAAIIDIYFCLKVPSDPPIKLDAIFISSAISIVLDIGQCCIFSKTWITAFIAFWLLNDFSVKCLTKFSLLRLPFLTVFQIIFSFPLKTYLWNYIILQKENAVSFVEI